MFLPKGKTIWRDLSSFFVDVDKLLVYMRNQALTGYIHFGFSSMTGLILLQEGDAISGLIEQEKNTRIGREPITSVLKQARKERNVTVTIQHLSARAVAIISDLFLLPLKESQRDLHSEFSDLGRFIDKLARDSFSGLIHIKFKNDTNTGFIRLTGGAPTAIVTETLQISTNRSPHRQIRMLNIHKAKLIERANNIGASYDVYIEG